MKIRKTLTLNDDDPVMKEALQIIEKKFANYFSPEVAKAICFYNKFGGDNKKIKEKEPAGTHEIESSDNKDFEERVSTLIDNRIPEISRIVENKVLYSIINNVGIRNFGTGAFVGDEPGQDATQDKIVSAINVEELDDDDDYDPNALDGFN